MNPASISAVCQAAAGARLSSGSRRTNSIAAAITSRNGIGIHISQNQPKKCMTVPASSEAVAEILACSTENVYVRLHRALARLRAELDDEMLAHLEEVNPYVSQ